jgi:hypothetical protein
MSIVQCVAANGKGNKKRWQKKNSEQPVIYGLMLDLKVYIQYLRAIKNKDG